MIFRALMAAALASLWLPAIAAVVDTASETVSGTRAHSMPGRAWFGLAPDSPQAFRSAAPSTVYHWPASFEKRAAVADERRLQVGEERTALKHFAPLQWVPVQDGWVARVVLVAEGAAGIRARIDLAGAPAIEIRASGVDGRIVQQQVGAGAQVAWGPWSEGDTQQLEIFAHSLPSAGSMRVGGIVHFDVAINAKAAGSCTVDAVCSTGDVALDRAIEERNRSVARLTFVDGGRAFLCSGTLIDSAQFPTPYFLTANHCIGRRAVADSIVSYWFYENASCGAGPMRQEMVQVAGGMEWVFADPNTDHTLLRMRRAPPTGAVFAGWDATKLSVGDSAVSLSHPRGDVKKLALGNISGSARFRDWEQSAWLMRFTRGIIEGGSSGSGVFTLANGKLTLRGVLSASTTDAQGALSCTNLDQQGVYNRLDVFLPQVSNFLLESSTFRAPDDHGNSPDAATPVPLNAGVRSYAARIDYLGDVDVYRLNVDREGTVVVRSSGGLDTVALLLDGNGERITSNDDAETRAVDFGLTRRVSPGTYYVAVQGWESDTLGPYTVSFELLPSTDNFTDLWWSPPESGWGISLDHQGGRLFGALYTYAADGHPEWYTLSVGEQQPDGSFEGPLYRTSGTPFFVVPWAGFSTSEVGRMRITFNSSSKAVLEYVLDGVSVRKLLERFTFGTAPACSWSGFDRSYARNFMDTWWTPGEDGWGIFLAHKGEQMVGTLYTYDASGRPTWFILSPGNQVGTGASFRGDLYRASGPAFASAPWGNVAIRNVGSMDVTFSTGNAGALGYVVDGTRVSKRIERFRFGTLLTECVPGG